MTNTWALKRQKLKNKQKIGLFYAAGRQLLNFSLSSQYLRNFLSLTSENHGVMAGPNSVIKPLYNVQGPILVNGTLGNPVVISADTIHGDEQSRQRFHLIIVAPKGTGPDEVARTLKENFTVEIIPHEERNKPTPKRFQLVPIIQKANYLSNYRARQKIMFNPNLTHLRPLYGRAVSYYVVPFYIKGDGEEIFGSKFRIIRDKTGKPIATRDVRKFDLVQRWKKPPKYGSRLFERHLGGLVIEDTDDVYLPKEVSHLKDQKKNFLLLLDPHTAARFELYKRKMIAEGDWKQLLNFNNPNDSAETAFRWADKLAQEGKLHGIFVLGDNVDFDTIGYTRAKNISESNHYWLARLFRDVSVGIHTIPGNHDWRPRHFPAWINSPDYNIPRSKALKYELKHYNLLSKLTLGITDATSSIRIGGNALTTYYLLQNRFLDYWVTYGSPKHSKPFRAVLFNTGSDDLAQVNENDPVYENQFWPSGIPMFHPNTMWRAISKGDADGMGFDFNQILWHTNNPLRRRGPYIALAHHPLVMSRKSKNYDPTGPWPQEREMIPPDENIMSGTGIRRREEMLNMLLGDDNFTCWISGHIHSRKRGFIVRKYQHAGTPKLHYFEAPILRTLNWRIDPDNPESVKHFWRWYRPLRSKPRLWQVQQMESGATRMLNLSSPQKALHLPPPEIGDLRSTLGEEQVAQKPFITPGTLSDRTFTLMTVNKDGYPTQMIPYFVNKDLKPYKNGYRIVHKVEMEMLDHERLIKQIKLAYPNLNDKQIKDRIYPTSPRKIKEMNNEDLESPLGVFPSTASLKTFPKTWVDYDPTTPTHISTTKQDQHFTQSIAFSWTKGINANETENAFSKLDIGFQYRFTRKFSGWIIRSMIEGASAGYQYIPYDQIDLKGSKQQIYFTLDTNHIIDWQIANPVLLEAANLSIGPRFIIYDANRSQSGKEYVGLKLHSNLFTLSWLPTSYLKFSFGLDWDNIHMGKNNWHLLTRFGVTYRYKSPEFR